MKKIIIFLLTLAMVSGALAAPVSATADKGMTKVYGWYCMRNSDHKQPPCEPSMRFIEKYDGYYIDPRYGGDSPEKVIYLTFDAGYENGNVEKILDVMKAEGVCGSFFILIHLIKAYPELVARMSNEGHAVCNHTAHHKNMTAIHDIDAFSAELTELSELYRKTVGKDMQKIYRPPEGKFSEENLKFASELGYKTVFWSFAYADWDNSRQMSPEAAKRKIISNIHNGEIMLLHPTSATNAAILGDVIRELKAQGYSFRTLEQLSREGDRQ